MHNAHAVPRVLHPVLGAAPCSLPSLPIGLLLICSTCCAQCKPRIYVLLRVIRGCHLQAPPAFALPDTHVSASRCCTCPRNQACAAIRARSLQTRRCAALLPRRCGLAATCVCP